MIKFEIIDTAERLDAIKQPYSDLWRQCRASVFQTHGWIAAWYRHFNTVNQLRVGVAWDDDRLIAVLPCTVLTYRGVRILEWAAQSFSDYCDAFGDPAMYPALWNEMAQRVDIVRLKNVSHNANVLEVLGLDPRLMRAEDDVCLKIRSVWSDGEMWWRNLNKKKRNNHTRGRRILEETGEVRVVHYDTPPPEVIEQIFTLKRGWMKANALASPLMDTDFALLHELVETVASESRLQLATLFCGDELVAGSINMAENNRLLGFVAAFNPKFYRVSPGIMLMTEYTRWAFDHGFCEIDYLRGAEPYKFEFANDRNYLNSFIAPLTWKGRAALALYNATKRSEEAANEAEAEVGMAYETQAGTHRIVAPRAVEVRTLETEDHR